MSLVTGLDDNASEIHDCSGTKKPDVGELYTLNVVELVLSTRLEDETFRGILNIFKARLPDKSTDEIEKPLVSLNHFKLIIQRNIN